MIYLKLSSWLLLGTGGMTPVVNCQILARSVHQTVVLHCVALILHCSRLTVAQLRFLRVRLTRWSAVRLVYATVTCAASNAPTFTS